MTNPCPSLRGRVVIVTGASRGLGREMALELAAAGSKVVICGSADTPELHATASDAEAAAGGDSILVHVADVADPAACDRLVAATLVRFDRIDVLINNAGRGMRLISETFNTVPTMFWDAKPDDWRAIIDANLNGAFYMARAVAPHLVAQGFGKIINVSTSDQTMVRKGYSPYGPSKAALEAASRVWAQDLEGTGVDVNVYLPGGAADTDLLPPSGARRGADGNLLPSSIMRRAVGWLCSDASNGHTGGRYIARLWDEALPASEAAAGSRSPQVERPAIM
jgi:NAD(P)-dependent dehydrogenase (short-subunit alcohol dehydrogenase family)